MSCPSVINSKKSITLNMFDWTRTSTTVRSKEEDKRDSCIYSNTNSSEEQLFACSRSGSVTSVNQAEGHMVDICFSL